ncbi:MAG: hypothetical protein TR69_WS6001000163 [candidate division WS6 bacterium OLB20]|uniref:Uncharacterized protein n=1 Tax=candidate division WS6 bacterium OLB20 TaxID=1617426 RepID=A0A136M057_9BACT|nr:MAG: hypothetical protein TR69_WS6001000163 [candidate division WS6 bacterium OLB20]
MGSVFVLLVQKQHELAAGEIDSETRIEVFKQMTIPFINSLTSLLMQYAPGVRFMYLHSDEKMEGFDRTRTYGPVMESMLTTRRKRPGERELKPGTGMLAVAQMMTLNLDPPDTADTDEGSSEDDSQKPGHSRGRKSWLK